jgi:DNA-binding ferritin-like protein
MNIMAKNKTFKRQAEATRLLEKIGATRRKSRKAGITVTGELKESLRGRQSPEIANALKFTANTALDEAEKLYDDLIDTADNIEDKTTQKMMQEYLSKYSEHIHSLHKSVKSRYRSLRVANRLEDVFNYSDAAYKILKNPDAYFGKKKWGAISGILNNLMGTYSRDIPPKDLKKLCELGEELGLNSLSDMDRAYSEYDNLLRNSDQMGEVLVNASNKLKSITKDNEEFIENNKEVYKKFVELASKYDLW